MSNILNFFPNDEKRTIVGKFHTSKIVKVERYNEGKLLKTEYRVVSNANPFFLESVMRTFSKLSEARSYMKKHTSY